MANNSPDHRCSRAPPLILDPCTTRIIRSLILGPSHAQWRHRSVPTVPDYDPRPILLSLPPIELHHHRYCCGGDLEEIQTKSLLVGKIHTNVLAFRLYLTAK